MNDRNTLQLVSYEDDIVKLPQGKQFKYKDISLVTREKGKK